MCFKFGCRPDLDGSPGAPRQDWYARMKNASAWRSATLLTVFLPPTVVGPVLFSIVIYWWFVPSTVTLTFPFANPSAWWNIGATVLLVPSLMMSMFAAECLAASLPRAVTNVLYRIVAPIAAVLALIVIATFLWLFAGVLGLSAPDAELTSWIFAGLAFQVWTNIVKKGLAVHAQVNSSDDWVREMVGLSASEVLSRDSRAPILYLRSFDMERARATAFGRLSYVRNAAGGFYLFARQPLNIRTATRESIAKIFRRQLLGTGRSLFDEQGIFSEFFSEFGPYIAIGRPGETREAMDIGSAKAFVSDEHWQLKVQRLLDASKAVVVEAGDTDGLVWEIREVLKRCDPEQVLLIAPRTQREYDQFRALAEDLFPYSFPLKLPDTRMIMFDYGWQPIPLEEYTMILADALQPFVERLYFGRS